VLGSATAGGQSTQVFLEAMLRGGPTERRRCCSTAPSETPRPA
jgi:hypothetical protein